MTTTSFKAFCLSVLAMSLPGICAALTFNVDTETDNAFLDNCLAAPGDCSLRGAIRKANLNAGIDIIELPAGNYGLSAGGDGENEAATGDLDITDALIINGSGIDSTVIDAGGDSGLLDRVFDVHSGAQLNLSDLTFGGGIAIEPEGLGGGMYNKGVAELSKVRVIANLGRTGPGIYNFGTLTVLDSVITGNNGKVVDDGSGGGISNSGTLTVLRSLIIGNGQDVRPLQGGGIYNQGTAKIEDSLVGDNVALLGGGVSNVASISIDLVRSTLSGNHAADSGGGLKVESGQVDIFDTTISDNTVDPLGIGGGISIKGDAFLHNSTISGNVVGGGNSGSGGGIRVETGGSVTMFFTTIAHNMALSGDALHNEGSATIFNSILHSPDLGGNPCSGTDPISARGNVISAPSFLNNNNATCGMIEPNDKVKVTPGALAMGPLAGNGGPTQTHALLEGSVAIDAAYSGKEGCPRQDQRGWIRSSLPCDSGAYEFNASDPDLLLTHSFEDGDAPPP